MSFEVYKRLCEELYNGKGDEHLFAHAFLKMEQNLIMRSDNCVNIHVQHIQWRSDSLIWYFGTLKAIKREIEPMILGMCIQTPRIKPFFLLSLWLSTPSLIPKSWPPIPSYFQVTISMKYFWRFSTESLTTVLNNSSPLELRKEHLYPTLSGNDKSQ